MNSYSSRLPWSFSANQLTRCLETLHAAGRCILDLTISNPTVVLPRYPHSSIAAAYANIPNFTYDPNPVGSLKTRSAISQYYEELGIPVETNRILLTASTSEAYSLLFKLLCNPGDDVMVPVPSYPLFEYLAALESVHTIPYPLRFDGSWYLNMEDISRRSSNRTRAIVVVSPHNPAGSFLKRAEAEHLLQWAHENGIAVIADEVFLDYKLSSAPEIVTTLTQFSEAFSFSLNGLSKSAGMPQMKLGWMVINGPETEREAARVRMELLLDTYLSVSTPVQAALPQLLQIGKAVRSELKHMIEVNLSSARKLFAGSPATPLHVEGGWSLIIQLPTMLSEEIWTLRLLEEKSVLVQPGYFFDMPSGARIVVSLITPPATFTQGIERIVSLAQQVCAATLG